MKKANIVFYGLTACAWIAFGIMGLCGAVNRSYNWAKPEFITYTILGFVMAMFTLFMMALNITKKDE